MSEKPSFFAELKRRNVYKVAVAYGVVAWLVIQVTATIVPALHLPDGLTTAVVVLVLVGFPIALVISWAFEMTPEGMKRTADVSADEVRSFPYWSKRKFAAFIIGVAVIAAGLFAYQFLHRPRSTTAATADSKREIAQQLGVANILEGSVQKAGDQVRITVQLINALKDDHLWADTYDRKMIDIFGVESDVAQKIAVSLEAKLTGREKQEVAVVGTKNPEAYDAYLHALALRGAQQLKDLSQQREFLQHAVDLDPNYAQAWAYLGATDSLIYFFPDSSAERKEKARTAVETALRLGPDLAEAHNAMGIYKYYCLQDYDGALAEFEIQLQHAPNDWSALFFKSLVLRRQGKFDDSIQIMKQAAVLDPLNEDIQINLASTYRGLRRFDESRAALDQVFTIAPDDIQRRYLKAETYLAQGDVDKAWESVKGIKVSPLDPSFGTYLGLLAVQRKIDEMITALSQLAEDSNIPPLFRAVSHAGLANLHLAKGDRAAALPFRAQAEQEIKPFLSQERFPFLAYALFVQMEARFGDRDAVERDVKRMFAETEKDKWQFPNSETAAATGYMLLGDFDRALPLLQDALARPSESSITPAYLRLDPLWDPIRKDPRFQKLANANP